MEGPAWVARQPFPTRGDKGVRAQSIRGRMALEGLYVPIKAPWYPAFRSELLSFPAGKYDDQVDALGLLGQLLDRMQSLVDRLTGDVGAGRAGSAQERERTWITGLDAVIAGLQ